jgi:hypothetical protein
MSEGDLKDMIDRQIPARAAVLALVAATAFVVQPAVASAQAGPPPPGGPPAPAYAPPPGAPPQAGGDYNSWAYQQDYQNYRNQYASWAEQNCITRHTNNIATGAIVGGVFGALLAGSIAGWAARGAWILFGGSLGLATGAAVGAATSAPGCPSGWAVRRGAPPFYYSGPAYAYRPEYPAYQPAYGPNYDAPRPAYRSNGGWYWDGYRWVRRPYPNYRSAPYGYGPY